jgi:hypothetical protein
MMHVHFVSFTRFTVHRSSIVTFSPLVLAFFYSDVIKSFFLVLASNQTSCLPCDR